MTKTPLSITAKKRKSPSPESPTHAFPRLPVFRKNLDYGETTSILDDFRSGKITGMRDFIENRRKKPSPIKDLYQAKRRKTASLTLDLPENFVTSNQKFTGKAYEISEGILIDEREFSSPQEAFAWGEQAKGHDMKVLLEFVFDNPPSTDVSEEELKKRIQETPDRFVIGTYEELSSAARLPYKKEQLEPQPGSPLILENRWYAQFSFMSRDGKPFMNTTWDNPTLHQILWWHWVADPGEPPTLMSTYLKVKKIPKTASTSYAKPDTTNVSILAAVHQLNPPKYLDSQKFEELGEAVKWAEDHLDFGLQVNLIANFYDEQASIKTPAELEQKAQAGSNAFRPLSQQEAAELPVAPAVARSIARAEQAAVQTCKRARLEFCSKDGAPLELKEENRGENQTVWWADNGQVFQVRLEKKKQEKLAIKLAGLNFAPPEGFETDEVIAKVWVYAADRKPHEPEEERFESESVETALEWARPRVGPGKNVVVMISFKNKELRLLTESDLDIAIARHPKRFRELDPAEFKHLASKREVDEFENRGRIYFYSADGADLEKTSTSYWYNHLRHSVMPSGAVRVNLLDQKMEPA